MPTYRLSARNQFRSPSGAVGEAPDGPGALAALSDDVDNLLGVGGAEYCANFAAITALPSSRTFAGKLAYNAFNGGVYRWNGTAWLPWQLPVAAYTPTVGNWTQGNGTKAGYFWMAAGVYHVKAKLTWGSTTALAASGITVSSPVGAIDAAAGVVGSCVMRDNSATGYLPMGLTASDSTAGTVRPIPLLSFTAANAGLNSSNAPIPFAVSDTLEMEWTYVPA